VKTKRNIVVIVVAACAVSGCTTPYLSEQMDLALKRDRGEITQEQYDAALEKQRKGQPWGGAGGVHEEAPSFVYTWSAP